MMDDYDWLRVTALREAIEFNKALVQENEITDEDIIATAETFLKFLTVKKESPSND